MWIKLQKIKELCIDPVDLFWEVDYFQPAVNNYNYLGVRGEMFMWVVPEHLINICGIKESMNQTSFYKHFPFVKSEKSHFIYVKEFSRSTHMSFWSNWINRSTGIMGGFIFSNQYRVIVIYTSCSRASWSFLTSKTYSLTRWWGLEKEGMTAWPSCVQAVVWGRVMWRPVRAQSAHERQQRAVLCSPTRNPTWSFPT